MERSEARAAARVDHRDLRIDIESLRALRAVIDTGSFTEAADRLGVTQSAVSHKIKRLEERIGRPLVERDSIVRPTPAGRDLLSYADRIVAAHDEAIAHLTGSDLKASLRLGSNEDLHSDELVEVLARFGRFYPDVIIDVRVGLSGAIADLIDAGELDLGLLQVPTTGPNRPRNSDMMVRHETTSWVVAPGVSFSPSEPLPLLSYGAGWTYGDDVMRGLATAGWTVRSALICPAVSGIVSAVEAGLGVGVINGRNRTDAMVEWPPGQAVPLPPVCSVLRTGVVTDPADQIALEALRREVAAQFSTRVDGAAARPVHG